MNPLFLLGSHPQDFLLATTTHKCSKSKWNQKRISEGTGEGRKKRKQEIKKEGKGKEEEGGGEEEGNMKHS